MKCDARCDAFLLGVATCDRRQATQDGVVHMVPWLGANC